MSSRFALVVVTDRRLVADAAARALDDLRRAGDRPGWTAAQREVVTRARRYLQHAAPDAAYPLVVVERLADVPAALTEPGVLALLVIDHHAHRPRFGAPTTTAAELSALALPAHVTFQPSPASVHVYTEPDDVALAAEPWTTRWLPADEWVIEADLVCAFTDAIQNHHADRLRAQPRPTALSTALAAFLDEQADNRWGLHYYTGSVVARFIDDLEQHAVEHGNPVVRGPSEHSLACSALARWQLDGAPALITVTSGMADEFRGTLANLRDARARGFIVCADSRPGQWFPFQGTIHAGEDSRAVMRARGLPTVHCDRPEGMVDQLAEAFEAYHADAGPVVLFVTREVLETTEPVTAPVVRRPAAHTAPSPVDDLVRVLNTEPVRLLCQVGPVESPDLVHTLARRAGMALADTLTHPGSVSRYRDGAVVEEYLGTLSLYGYSARVHEFLHRDGKLRPRSEQALLFLNSRIAEVDTPFSQLATRRTKPLQVVPHAAEVAPFAQVGVTGPVPEVLRAVLARLDVDPAVLALRRAAIRSTVDSFSDVVGLLPVLPMSPNYFFRRLSGILGGLIRDGYRYTGVYDVGRAALSAVCNLPRTGPGFSGWFGRALMGDALSALPGIVLGRPDNVLAFVGDGAAALVPDIVPTLVRQVVADRVSLPRNVSIFTFVNGGHSVIRTYRESLQPGAVGAQTGVLTLPESDWRRRIGDLTMTHRRLTDVDALATQLLAPGLNRYTVPLGHNNEGDGLSLMAAVGWQRDELTSRTLAVLGADPTERRAA